MNVAIWFSGVKQKKKQNFDKWFNYFIHHSTGFFKHFAMTSVNVRGRQVMTCPLGYTYTKHGTTCRGTWWRCNKSTKSRRCQLRVYTEMIDGYEMIETLKHHNHPPSELPSMWTSHAVIIAKVRTQLNKKCWSKKKVFSKNPNLLKGRIMIPIMTNKPNIPVNKNCLWY